MTPSSVAPSCRAALIFGLRGSTAQPRVAGTLMRGFLAKPCRLIASVQIFFPARENSFRSMSADHAGTCTASRTGANPAPDFPTPARPELENLVQDLRQCEMPYTCPHGRPTLIEMNFRELERKFGRTQ